MPLSLDTYLGHGIESTQGIELKEGMIMIPHIGTTELIIILVIAILIFGVGKLAGIGGVIGRALYEFRKAQSGELLTNEQKQRKQDPDETKEKTEN
jgi:sec-independent protein translocase protein TatA